MKIGILGSGQVGQTLAKGFSDAKHQVMIGSNDSAKQAELSAKLGPQIKTGNFSQTADFGELLVLCVKGSAAEEIVRQLRSQLDAKTVIDTTNPIGDKPQQDGVLNYFTDYNSSLMERLVDLAPKANFVKAFNSVGSGDMVNPKFDTKPTMFICGNNAEAKATVSDILEVFGWEVADLGKATSARAIEPLCMLWCIPGFLNNQWHHAFKLVK